MTSINPVRGPEPLPRLGRLRPELVPQLNEIVVLRSRAGRLVELPRGVPPTFGQRLVGGFTKAYFVASGTQTRTFTAKLPTADIGVELMGEVDVELVVDDCSKLVREWNGDLGEQLGNWCQDQAALITSRHSITVTGNPGEELTRIGSAVANALRVNAQRPQLMGLSLRELRVRLRYADEDTIKQAGTDTLRQRLKARRAQDLMNMYQPVYGPDIAQMITLLADDPEKVPEIVERIQVERQVTGQRRIDLFRDLVTSPSIEAHVRERLALELSKQLRANDGDQEIMSLTAGILTQAGAAASRGTAPHDDTDEDEDD